MRYAAFQAIVIAWWTSALSGTSLSKLHYNWVAGFELRGALTIGRQINMFAIVCLVSTLVAIDGPLLQSSTTIITGPHPYSPMNMTFSIAQEIPAIITGYIQHYNNGFVKHGTSQIADEAFKSLWKKVPMDGYVKGCEGTTCRATVQAPALAISNCEVGELFPEMNSRLEYV